MPRLTPLLMLPGSLCDARLFAPQMQALRQRAVCVGDIGGATSIAGIAAEVLRRAPARFTVAGLSMGGIVALEMWRQAPARVAGLALLDTTFMAEGAGVAERRAREMDAVRSGGTAALLRILRDTYLPKYFAARNRDDLRLQELVVQMAAACGPDMLQRQWSALATRPDSRATLATIDCPSLVACGSEDLLCPPALHEVMASLIGVPCRVLDRCGHLSTVESPDETTALIADWLHDVDRRKSVGQEGERDVAC